MLPQLPLDVLVHILACLLPVRNRRDQSTSTLVACLRTTSILEEAASLPVLWKSHYETRYKHCDAERERTRRETFGSQSPNWRLLYVTRRRIDNVAIKHLDNLLQNRRELRRTGECILDLSMDVWDVLELESHFSEADEDIPQHALTRSFWANSLLQTLSRSRAVLVWRKFWLKNFPEPTFEHTMNLLSGFFGYSNERILAQLDQLASRCRQHLRERRVVIDPKDHGYSSLDLCRGICVFMKIEGFLPPDSSEYHEIMSRFPHAYLSTHKKTIPISLVHIFSAIGMRLGLQVSPINYPGTVLAYVIPREQNLQPIIVNPSSHIEQDFAEQLSTSRALAFLHSVNPVLSVETNLQPCGGQLMLLRAGRNVISILPTLRYMQSPVVYPCVLFAFCTRLLFEADNPALEILASILKRKAQSLDCIFLLRDLHPVLQSRCQKVLQNYCDDVLGDEDEFTITVRRRSVSKMKYFLGMPCRSSFGHLGFIYGWERKSPSDCTDYEITPPLVSDRIERETYHILGINGTDQLVFLPEGNIMPTTFTKSDVKSLFEKCPGAAVYFSGMELPNEPSKGIDYAEGRGRLLLSPHAHCWYPEDDVAGSSWVRTGSLSCD